MIDAACCGKTLVEKASVSVETLRDLTRLLRAVGGTTGAACYKASTLLPDAGGACAKVKTSKRVRSSDDPPSDAAGAAVARHANRGSRANDKTTGAASTSASTQTTRRAARRAGGVGRVRQSSHGTCRAKRCCTCSVLCVSGLAQPRER
jgi:hypothetical protein